MLAIIAFVVQRRNLHVLRHKERTLDPGFQRTFEIDGIYTCDLRASLHFGAHSAQLYCLHEAVQMTVLKRSN